MASKFRTPLAALVLIGALAAPLTFATPAQANVLDLPEKMAVAPMLDGSTCPLPAGWDTMRKNDVNRLLVGTGSLADDTWRGFQCQGYDVEGSLEDELKQEGPNDIVDETVPAGGVFGNSTVRRTVGSNPEDKTVSVATTVFSPVTRDGKTVLHRNDLALSLPKKDYEASKTDLQSLESLFLAQFGGGRQTSFLNAPKQLETKDADGFTCQLPADWKQSTADGELRAKPDGLDADFLNVSCSKEKLSGATADDWTKDYLKGLTSGWTVTSHKLSGDTLTVLQRDGALSQFSMVKTDGKTRIIASWQFPTELTDDYLALLKGKNLIAYSGEKAPSKDGGDRGIPAKTGSEDDLFTPLAGLALGLTAVGAAGSYRRFRRQ